MSSWARPGVKCVSLVTFRDLTMGETGPVEGGIYTIRDVVPEPDGICGLRFEEISNSPRGYADGRDECTFNVTRFRPLITQEQDLALFRHLLNPSPVDVGLVPAGVELDA